MRALLVSTLIFVLASLLYLAAVRIQAALRPTRSYFVTSELRVGGGAVGQPLTYLVARRSRVNRDAEVEVRLFCPVADGVDRIVRENRMTHLYPGAPPRIRYLLGGDGVPWVPQQAREGCFLEMLTCMEAARGIPKCERVQSPPFDIEP